LRDTEIVSTSPRVRASVLGVFFFVALPGRLVSVELGAGVAGWPKIIKK